MRVVKVPEMLRAELQRHLDCYVGADGDAFVFAGEKGGTLRRHVWQKVWDRARRETGMEYLHFHDLRHTGNTFTQRAARAAARVEVLAGATSRPRYRQLLEAIFAR